MYIYIKVINFMHEYTNVFGKYKDLWARVRAKTIVDMKEAGV